MTAYHQLITHRVPRMVPVCIDRLCMKCPENVLKATIVDKEHIDLERDIIVQDNIYKPDEN